MDLVIDESSLAIRSGGKTALLVSKQAHKIPDSIFGEIQKES